MEWSATRLLIVDDDERYADALSELLSASFPRIQIHCVTTIDEACRRVDSGSVDMVILDLGLPDADGIEALERLHDCMTEIPIIVLTSQLDEVLALEALKSGAEDYLVKGSVDQPTLTRSVRYALERHRGIRDLARVSRELQFANAALEKLTLIDPLTELLNRRGLQQALTREIKRLERENIDVLVLLVDIDDFKRVNDSFGHAVGDVALQEIAQRLSTCVRGADYACRIGGDEFLLLLPNADRVEAARIAERARVSIATITIQHSTGTLRLTASVAAMLLRRDTPSIDELLTTAHQLLQRSKKEGKNRVVYEEEEFDDTEKRHDAQAELCTDLAQGKNLRTVKQNAGQFFPCLRRAQRADAGRPSLSARGSPHRNRAAPARKISREPVPINADRNSGRAPAGFLPPTHPTPHILRGDQRAADLRRSLVFARAGP